MVRVPADLRPALRRLVAAVCTAALALRSASIICIHADGDPRAESCALVCSAGIDGCSEMGDDDEDGPGQGCDDYSLSVLEPQVESDSAGDLVAVAADGIPVTGPALVVPRGPTCEPVAAQEAPAVLLEHLRTVVRLL